MSKRNKGFCIPYGHDYLVIIFHYTPAGRIMYTVTICLLADNEIRSVRYDSSTGEPRRADAVWHINKFLTNLGLDTITY